MEEQKKWYAVYVNSRAEKKVAELLLSKGIEAYVPLVSTLRQWSDRKKKVELVLLNGYVFIRIDAKEQEQVLQTRGVVAFVRLSGQRAAIPDVEIERLKQLTALGYQLDAEKAGYKYKEGEKVKITSGVLRNLEGVIIENKEGRWLDVMLESIGQSIRVKLPADVLTPLD